MALVQQARRIRPEIMTMQLGTLVLVRTTVPSAGRHPDTGYIRERAGDIGVYASMSRRC
jgi:hypothetical protein